MSPRASTEQLLGDAEICPHAEDRRVSRDYSFLGASHERRELEKTLLRKLDLRIAFLVVVSIMNYVSFRSPPGRLDNLLGLLDGSIQCRVSLSFVTALKITDSPKVLHG